MDMEHCGPWEGDDILIPGGNADVDMISSLCDVVIHHILSFLPVRDAAKTCILSKRWRKVWASAPAINFDQKYFLQKRKGALTSRAAHALAHFMSGALLCREQTPLKLLQISLSYSSFQYYPTRQWIQIAMMLNVNEMHLDFSGGEFFLHDRGPYAADPCLAYFCVNDGRSGWESLSDSDSETDESDSSDDTDSDEESVSGSSSDGLTSSRFVLLPSMLTYGFLRVLHLTKCNITYKGPMVLSNLAYLVLRDVDISQKLLHELLSHCCGLEKLELRRIAMLKCLAYSSPRLQSLTLECCHCLEEVTIVAEALQTFRLGLHRKLEVLSLYFPALVKVVVGLCQNGNESMEQRVDHLLKLLKRLEHVKDLTLHSEFFKDMAISKAQIESFTMSNVTRFEIIGKMDKDAVPVISGFLQVFPNLESLLLFFAHPNKPENLNDHYDEKQFETFESSGMSCLQSHLKELKIGGFEGNNLEISLVKFLLDNAKVLKNIGIKTRTPSFLSHGEISTRLLSWGSSQQIGLNYC